MKFEFDNNKSKENKNKHGIDFIEAQMLGMTQIGLRFQLKQRTNRDI